MSDWLAARAVRATQVLLVECPGAWALRVSTERAVAQRGWRIAPSPASADVLIVAGRPGTELAEVLDRLWEAMPGPRARLDIGAGSDIRTSLDDAAKRLTDSRAQAEDAAHRADRDPSVEEQHAEMDHAGHEGMDHRDDAAMGHGDDGEVDHEGMDHGSMDHEGMEMAPDGIPLAEGSEDDRDGLEMDAMPVRLGPVLPHWPAGLVLDVTLHGDLVVDATARLLDDNDVRTAGREEHATAKACDDVAALLDLAGWPDVATRARTARDQFLDGRDDTASATLADVRQGVTASRLLRWSLRGVGVLRPDRVREVGLPEHLAGDCLDRLDGLLDRAGDGTGSPVPVAALGQLVTGCDLAVARLVAASLGGSFARAGVSSGA
ncbi:MAG: hypothetical protein ABIQ61_04305 [Ornithinibacter sp.]